MKIKLNTNLLLALIIIGYIGYFVILGMAGISSQYFTAISEPAYFTNNLPPMDKVIPDTISYKKYNKLNDSIKTVRNFRNGDYFLAGGAAWSFSPLFGIWNSYDCDTCNTIQVYFALQKDSPPINYYIKLNGWGLKLKKTPLSPERIQLGYPGIDSVYFYVKNKQAYIRKLALLQTYKGEGVHHYQLVDEPVKFRYNHADQCLMIPISKTVKNFLDYLIMGVALISLFYTLLLIGMFISFIIDLSKGNSFTAKNVRRLRLIAISLLIYPLIIVIFNFLFRLIFHNYFTADVTLNSMDSLGKILLIGIIFLALYKAFRQGKILKEEQDLTV